MYCVASRQPLSAICMALLLVDWSSLAFRTTVWRTQLSSCTVHHSIYRCIQRLLKARLLRCAIHSCSAPVTSCSLICNLLASYLPFLPLANVSCLPSTITTTSQGSRCVAWKQQGSSAPFPTLTPPSTHNYATIGHSAPPPLPTSLHSFATCIHKPTALDAYQPFCDEGLVAATVYPAIPTSLQMMARC